MKKPTSTGDDLTGDAAQVRGLITWAISAGVGLGTVTVGSCTVELRGGPSDDAQAPPERVRESVYDRFGGPALAHAVDTGIPGHELQPVIGRTR